MRVREEKRTRTLTIRPFLPWRVERPYLTRNLGCQPTAQEIDRRTSGEREDGREPGDDVGLGGKGRDGASE